MTSSRANNLMQNDEIKKNHKKSGIKNPSQPELIPLICH
jgi:hypothetical protein